MSDERTRLEQILENTRKSMEDQPSDYGKVLLPIIERVLPQLIANDIIGVQPMFSPHSKEEWPYQVDLLGTVKYAQIGEVKRWCQETLNEGDWAATVQFFAFKTEEAYNWFTLRWS